MTFKITFVVFFLCALFAASYFGALFYSAQQVQSHILSFLDDQKFEKLSYRRVAQAENSIILYGVSFDDHDFYTIDRITISYDPFDFLLEQRISSITLNRPAVTLESSDIEFIRTEFLSKIPVDTLFIEEGEINFLAGPLGDFILLYDADIKKQEDGIYLTARYKSGQPHIKLSGSFQGPIYHSRPSTVVLTLDGVEFDSEDIKIKRSNGSVALNLTPGNLLNSTALLQLTAGSINLFSFPWVNANFSFEGGLYNHHLLVSAKAADSEDTEFSYTYEFGDEAIVNHGAVFSSSGKEFYRYLNRSGIYIIAPDDQPKLFDMGEVSIDFELTPSERVLVYHLPNKKGALRREVILPKEW